MFGCGDIGKGDIKDDRVTARMMILLIESGKKGEEILSEGMMNLILDTGSRSQSQTHSPNVI